MVVVKETVRLWPEEQELLINVPYPEAGTGGAVWSVEQTWNNILIVTKMSLVVWWAESAAAGVPNGVRVQVRDGSTNWYNIGGACVSSGATEVSGIVRLPAGTWDVRVLTWNSTNYGCLLGVTNFSDFTGDELNENLNFTINNGVTSTVINENITGVLRECCLGTIRRHVIRLEVSIESDTFDDAGTYEDVGGSAGANQWAAYVYRDGVQADWTEVMDQLSGMDEGGANLGQYGTEADIEDTITIRVDIENNTGGNVDYDIYWSISASPWFELGDYTTPILINIPQASTGGIISESLDDEIDADTKYIGLGSKKALGQAHVYGTETSGTAIQEHTDTLTNRPTHGLELYLKGWKSCVTLLVADRRG